jgi:hypothetical protein
VRRATQTPPGAQRGPTRARGWRSRALGAGLAIALGPAAAACQRRAGSAADATAQGSAPAGSAVATRAAIAPCAAAAFAASTDLPEASGAAWVELGGAPHLLLVADSGHRGAYVILDAATGEPRERGALPLGGPGDDLEGLASRGGRVYAISSAGWIREYARAGGGAGPGFDLVAGPYPLAPVRPGGPTCAQQRFNCGANFEGLCLAPGPTPGPCLGYAAAKAEGKLYCVIAPRGPLELAALPPLDVAGRERISDCAVGDDGALYLAMNLRGLGAVERVTRWADPARAERTALRVHGAGSPEALAVRGRALYLASDLPRGPSLLSKIDCAGP